MAVDVKYRIKSEDDTKRGVDSATSNLDRLGNAAKSVSNVLKAVGIGFSIGAVIKGVGDSIKAFETQEQSELRLIAASRNNPYINGTALAALKNTAKAYQGVTEFSDEAIMQQQALLVGMGLNKDQIDAVMNAAVNLAATGVTTLDGAVRNLGKTYGGMTGELGELVPALKNLTAEQLKSGAGVAYISQQYAGMAEAAASGVAGTMAKFTNSFSDLKASIGNILGTVAGAAATALQPAIQSVTGWLSKHRDEVVGFFINFPKIAAAAFDFAGKVIQKVFTLDFLWNLIKSLFEFLKNQFFLTINLLWTFLQAIGKTLWEPLRVGFEWIGFGIKTAWQAVVGALVDALNFITSPIQAVINGIIKGINKAIELGQKIGLFQGAGPVSEISLKVDKPTFDALTQPKPIDSKGIETAWNKALGAIVPYVVDTAKNVVGLVVDVGMQFKDEFDAFTGQVGDLIQQGAQANREATKNLQDVVDKAKEGATPAETPTGTPIGPQMSGPSVGEGPAPNPLADIMNMLSSTFSGLLGAVMPLITSLSSVQALMNPLSTILNAMMTILAPLINSMLQPLVGILVILGQTIGKLLVPVIEMLAPAIKLLGQVFLFLYNYIILPIVNFTMIIFNGIYNLIAGIWNFIANTLNSINIFGWHPFSLSTMSTRSWNQGFLTPISETDLSTAGATVTNSGTGAGGGTAASYTQAPDIYITVYVYNGLGVMTDKTMTLEELSIEISNTTKALIAKGTL